MNTKNKGFLSLETLLFVLIFFSVLVNNRPENNLDFVIVKTQSTKKHSATINFEEIVKKELLVPITDPDILNVKINQKIISYLNQETSEEWFIVDNKTNIRKPVTILELEEITKTLVLRPMPNVYVKRYTITNGLLKNKHLGFEMKTAYSKTTFIFPKNYSVEVIVYT